MQSGETEMVRLVNDLAAQEDVRHGHAAPGGLGALARARRCRTARPSRDRDRGRAGVVVTPPAEARDVAEAIASALHRLAGTLDALSCDDLAQPSRAIGTSRREAILGLVGRLDRTVAALHRRSARRAPADPRDAARLARGDGALIAAAVADRRRRLGAAVRRVLADVACDDLDDVRDELEALLARIELAHVALDARYCLGDLPPLSAAACTRAQAHEPPQDEGHHRRRARAIARRRGGLSWPRGRRSS